MANASPDHNIRVVLQRAAGDPAFQALLLNDREEALKGFSLTVAEKGLLLAATATQLEKMVEQARDQRWYERPVTRRVVGLTAAAGVLTLGGLVWTSSVHSLGIRPEQVGHLHLQTIVRAQAVYREQYGRYGSLEELTGGDRPALFPDIVTRGGRFVFEMALTGDSFTAIARQKGTQRAWQAGPDGQVRPLE